MLIADMGSVRPGVPTLTVALRGTAQVTIEVTTLAGAKHSGQYGGAAPDALIVILHALASLHDENGDVAVAGSAPRAVDRRRLQRGGVPRARRDRGRAAAVRNRRPRLAALVGAGDHRHRHRRAVGRERAQRRIAALAGLAERPRPSRAGSRRGAGRRDRASAQRCGRSGSTLEVHAGAIGQGFATGTSGPAYTAARAAMATAWGTRAGERGDRRLDPARRGAAGGGARTPRSCCSARPTATATSTPRTSACCSTSSRSRSWRRRSSSGSSRQR